MSLADTILAAAEGAALQELEDAAHILVDLIAKRALAADALKAGEDAADAAAAAAEAAKFGPATGG